MSRADAFGLLYLGGFGVGLVALLLACSIALHRGAEWVRDEDRISRLGFYLLTWPLSLTVFLLWEALLGMHRLIGVVVKPRPAVKRDEHMVAAEREVEKLLDLRGAGGGR